jgi:hypothetical protein
MKKFLYVLVTLCVIYVGWYCFTYRDIQKPVMSEPTNPQSQTNLTEINPNFPTKVPRPTPTVETNESMVEMTNALTATNIEQWKAAIKGLRKSPGLSESWDMETTNRNIGVPVSLEENGQSISYKARFIDISIKNENGDILEAQLQSPIMNIDQTRELGLQICDMLNIDPKGFLAWCDQVGNRWLDQPLFGDGDGHHHYSFHLLHSYNDEKPWVINFMIIPNP